MASAAVESSFDVLIGSSIRPSTKMNISSRKSFTG